MIVALAMAAGASQMSVLDAERAFAKLAQEKGQWTAFRATAAPDAVMFVPQPVTARAWLKDKRDPAQSVKWWPTRAWQSCDGTLAVTTGGALWPDGHYSRFTTVWRHQPDGGWKWVYDNGEDVAAMPERPHKVSLERSPCEYEYGHPLPPLVHVYDAEKEVNYASTDVTLAAGWFVAASGRHDFQVWQAGQGGFVHTLSVPAPTRKP